MAASAEEFAFSKLPKRPVRSETSHLINEEPTVRIGSGAASC